MATFEILRRASVVARVDTESRAVSYMNPAGTPGGRLVFSEEDRITFRLSPDEPDLRHRILIGDVSLAEALDDPDRAGGESYGDFRIWAESSAFESARGRTDIRLESVPIAAAEGAWRTRVSLPAYVLPTKLGDDRYQAMSTQVESVSRSLLVDLYGKSRRGVSLDAFRDGRHLRAPHEELRAIAATASRLGTILPELERSPVSRTTRVMAARSLRHGTRFTAAELQRIRPETIIEARRRPVFAWTGTLRESHDVPEHRAILGFMRLLQSRVKYCARSAQRQRQRIETERSLRDISFQSGPTIYQTQDLPRIQRLTDTIDRAQAIYAELEDMCLGRLYRDLQPDLAAMRGAAFTRGTGYMQVIGVIQDYLVKSAVWTEYDADEVVAKLTHRLFEQWCFIRIVDAFREAGLALEEWRDEMRQHLVSQFVLDFDRGTEFAGILPGGRRLRLRYEPWVRSEANARALGESLCRGGRQDDVSWSPDIVIELQQPADGAWVTEYAIVMDAKYSRQVRDRHWSDTRKYEYIRNTAPNARPVVKQLWLVVPRIGGAVEPEDPAVEFGAFGPTCARDESSRFVLGADPMGPTVDPAGAFALFARGTLEYLTS